MQQTSQVRKNQNLIIRFTLHCAFIDRAKQCKYSDKMDPQHKESNTFRLKSMYEYTSRKLTV